MLRTRESTSPSTSFRHAADRDVAATTRRAAVMLALVAGGAGCETNSWFDPSRTGAFNTTATTMPILERLDIVETGPQGWADAQPPTAEDLIPNDFEYRLSPGDLLRIEIYELLRDREMDVTVRNVDQSGNVRLPTIGDVPAAGLTVQQFQEEIENRLKPLIPKPNVSVSLDEQRSLQFTVLGMVQGAGSYRLVRPDVRLLEALAIAGGVPPTTHRIYVLRRIPLSESVASGWEQRGRAAPSATPTTKPVDIDELIRQLSQPGVPVQPPSGSAPERNPASGTPGDPPAQPPITAARRQGLPPPVDVDELMPPAAPGPMQPSPAQPVRGAPVLPPPATSSARLPADEFHYDAVRNAWVRLPAGGALPPGPSAQSPGEPAPGADVLDAAAGATTPLFAERIVAVEYRELISGDSRLNIVVRPNDVIYVQPFEIGFVYIDGEILRAGSYELPATGGLTLSRLVAAAGGLGSVAIPDRVEVTRMIASSREATVRVSLAAIRRRTEPDLFLKPGDHINIGTNFWAVPLAVIRNGFRMTYGFGFLLDRNFGNDVFGPPPESNPFN